jgi:hypothetical protein
VLNDDDKQWIASRIEKSETSLRGEFADRFEKLETRFAERLERVETTLLTEFHKWASPVELRQRSHAAAMRAFDAEMQALSDRVKTLEGR